MVEATEHLWAKKETNRKKSLTPYTKNKSKWNIDLDVEHKFIKLLEENIGQNLQDPQLGKEFLEMTRNVHFIKENINKLEPNKIKTVVLKA
jgi:DNA topoisomerase VI subunit A